MKTNSTCELSRTWWSRERPKALTKSGSGFERALIGYEKAYASILDGATHPEIKSLKAALGDIVAAAKDVVVEAKMLAKAAKTPDEKKDLTNTIDVMGKPLQKRLDTIRSEIGLLMTTLANEGREKDEDPEDSGDALTSPTAQAEYVRSFASRLRRRRHNFALGLPSKDPTDMRFAFHAKKPARSLASLVKTKAGAKSWVYGTAGTHAPDGAATDDPAKPKILLLDIEGGKRVPGLARRVKLMFKRLGISAFQKVRILEAGVAVEDDGEGADAAKPTAAPSGPAATPAPSASPGPAPADPQPEPAADPQPAGERPSPNEPVRARVLTLLSEGLARLKIPGGLPPEARDRLATARTLLETRLAKAQTTEALWDVARALDVLKAALAKAVEEAKIGEAELSELKTRLAALIRTLPTDLAPLQTANAEVSKADTLAADGNEPQAKGVLRTLHAALTVARDKLLSTIDRLLTELLGLADPPGATEDERRELEAARQAIRALLTDGAPTVAKVQQAVGLLKPLRARHAAIRRAATRRSTMARFEAVIGTDAAVTDAMITQQEAERAAKQAAVEAAAQRAAAAGAMPSGTPTEAAAKLAAIAETQLALGAAQVALAAEVAKLNAMRGKKGLTEALGTGALAPDARTPLSDTAATALIEAYARDPALAAAASEAALTAPHPDAVAEGVGALIDLVDTGFAAADGRTLPGGEAAARAYAEGLLKMGGHLGGDFFEDAQAYVAEGRHLATDPVGDAGIDPTTGTDEEKAVKRAQIERKRSAHVAGALLDGDGKLDLDGDALADAVGDLKFHPGQLESPTPALNAHIEGMLETLGETANQERAQAILDGAAAPTNPAALKLLRTATGKDAGAAVSDAETREVILASLLTPVTQAAVGSCFATAGVRRMGETDPLALMQQLTALATTGVYTPANGDDPIPAITRIPEGEDQLIRSLEYSAATAGTRAANSRFLDNLRTGLEAGIGQFRTALGHASATSLDWRLDRARIRAGHRRGFTYVYDSTAATAPSPDGSSSQGVFKLVEVSTSTEITDRAGYVAAFTRIALTALEDSNLSAAQEQAVRTLVASDAFITAISGTRQPWALRPGGFPDEADDVIYGGNPQIQTFLAADTTQSMTQRSQALLSAIMADFSGRAGQMVGLNTNGIHAFNGLPNHPSLAPLRGATPADVQAKVQTHLIDAGATYRDTALTAARTLQAYDTAIAHVRAYNFNAGARRGLIDTGAAANRPTGPLSPGVIRTNLRAALDAAAESWGDERALQEKTDEEAAGRAFSAADLTAAEARWKRAYLDWCIDRAGEDLADTLTPPEFTIADTNWGDGTYNVYFVIATNPLTGAASLYSKTDPPGTLRPMGKKWVDTDWQTVD